MEKIISDRIIDYIVKFNILHSNQHGFIPGRSVETATFDFLKYVYDSVDSGKYVVCLFFDLSVAFDTVNRSFLLSKLYQLGIRGTILEWISSYMTGRTMSVKYNNCTSAVKSVDLGVPQGSVLGPLLFILYTNDLFKHVIADNITMYADDTTIVVRATDLGELELKIERVRCMMNAWCKKNDLILNGEKTVYMNIFNRKPIPDNFTLRQSINFSEKTKFLGIHIDQHLSFEHHIQHVCSKLNSAFYAILKLKHTLDEGGLLSVYYALAYSFMADNVMTWGSSSWRGRVFIGQKRILRMLFNLGFRESCRELFITKNILTFPCIFIYKCLKYVNRNRPTFKKLGSNTKYNVRETNLMEIPAHKSAFFENGPVYMCARLYNALPRDVRFMQGKKFENQVKRLLLNNAFYSIDDYLTNG